jgi:poly-gamma-glutamate synthesis protein (capsule biosynthesis protein)
MQPQAVVSPSPLPPARLWLDPAAPEALRLAAEKSGALLADSPAGAAIRLALTPAQPAQGASTWIYALVAAFPTVRDGVTIDELKAAWNGSPGALLMSASTSAAMQPLFGGQVGTGVRVVAAQDLTADLWQERGAWAIVPFEALEPKMKVLEIDGQSPLRKEFEAGAYPLVAHFRLEPGVAALPAGNRDPQKLVTVLMTGTTALVRAISYKMQTNGITYPARDIGDWLRGADILHISNEVAFSDQCPPPNPNDGSLRFCSAADNIGLLDDIGVDVIELSGNHVNDWGTKALASTLELYSRRGWPVFAGGADAAQARQPAILERGGVKFAFVGCNAPGPDFAWATADSPGAAQCGDYAWLVDQIRRLKADGDVVIVALQHYEYYSPDARPLQNEDFRRLAEAGADVVSGSQAHYSQAMEFYAGSFIHYGLGNLFFDQMGYDYANGTRTTNTRREFLDRHVFYNGKLIGVELLTAMLEDYSKPRPMTPEERAAFLSEYFSASGW